MDEWKNALLIFLEQCRWINWVQSRHNQKTMLSRRVISSSFTALISSTFNRMIHLEKRKHEQLVDRLQTAAIIESTTSILSRGFTLYHFLSPFFFVLLYKKKSEE